MRRNIFTLVVLVPLVVFILIVMGGCGRKEKTSVDNSVNNDAGQIGKNKEQQEKSNVNFTLGLGDYDYKFTYDGIERRYRLHVPEKYDKTKPTPVILVFHGGSINADTAPGAFQMNPKSDKEGFIVAYPEGTGYEIKGRLLGSWNAEVCCAPATINKVDDVGFTKKVIADIQSKFNIDDSRIFATGMSNGALMVFKLACELSDTLAAVSASGYIETFEKCEQSRPVPIMYFHGTADPCVNYNGGVCGGCTAQFFEALGYKMDTSKSQRACESVPSYIESWRKKYACNSNSEISYQKGDATCYKYSNCKNKSEIVFCKIEGMGHQWAGVMPRSEKSLVGPSTTDISANDEMWLFFQAHPK